MSFNKNDGSILWEYTEPAIRLGRPLAVANGTVFVSEYTGPYLRALDEKNGSLKWRFDNPDYGYGPGIAYHDGLVFVGRRTNNVTAFNAGTGEIVWNFVGGGPPMSPPIVADGKVLITMYDGYLYALDEKTGNIIWKFYGKKWRGAGPCVANGRVLVGNSDGTVYSLGSVVLPPTDLRTSVVDEEHIRLDWEASVNPFLDHYLIYRSDNGVGFDFSDPVYNTSSDANPLRTNWINIYAATVQGDVSYVVRVVSSDGYKSTTSNTA
ncbi:MAG: PQQ-binding-like beta-propeller repeat protein, partial [Thermoplasmata archaeon]|nr:PQQ-binding-like beta-propeller repeat protein [Thermoplasmata archaeon]